MKLFRSIAKKNNFPLFPHLYHTRTTSHTHTHSHVSTHTHAQTHMHTLIFSSWWRLGLILGSFFHPISFSICLSVFIFRASCSLALNVSTYYFFAWPVLIESASPCKHSKAYIVHQRSRRNKWCTSLNGLITDWHSTVLLNKNRTKPSTQQDSYSWPLNYKMSANLLRP